MATTADPKPISVLFVCLGNICRSPMAEAVFRHQVSTLPPSTRAQIDTIDSAGTGAYHTLEPPDDRTLETLSRHSITDYTHGARKVTPDDFTAFDYILAMDRWNMRDLERLRARTARQLGVSEGDVRARVRMFGAFAGTGGKKGKKGDGEEVVDPYYGADDGFEVVFRQCVGFSKGFLEEVLRKETADGEGVRED